MYPIISLSSCVGPYRANIFWYIAFAFLTMDSFLMSNTSLRNSSLASNLAIHLQHTVLQLGPVEELESQNLR